MREARQRPRVTAGRRIPVADLDVMSHWAAIRTDTKSDTQNLWMALRTGQRQGCSKLATAKIAHSLVILEIPPRMNSLPWKRSISLPIFTILLAKVQYFCSPLLLKQNNQQRQVVCAGPEPEPRQTKDTLLKKQITWSTCSFAKEH